MLVILLGVVTQNIALFNKAHFPSHFCHKIKPKFSVISAIADDTYSAHRNTNCCILILRFEIA
jgi:hypothetical protein